MKGKKHGHYFRQEQTSAWFHERTEMPDPAGEKTCSPVSLLSDYVKDMQAQKGPAKQAEQANKQAGNQAEAAAQTTSAENANIIPA